MADRECPHKWLSTVPYLVSQPEITSMVSLRSSLKKQQITSIEISPAALPGELDLTDNKFLPSLNNLFDQLPDVNHIEETMKPSPKSYLFWGIQV